MRLIITGGGTGGHLYPGVAVAEELLSRGGGHEVLFVGSASGIEARVLPKLGLEFKPVRCGALAGRGLLGKIGGLLKTAVGMIDSVGILRRFKPDACLGVGGYVSFPVAASCKFGGVFTAIQEQNAVPGIANRALANIVARVYAADGQAGSSFDPQKTLITGTPLRQALGESFPYEPPTADEPARILILGGSQGAKALNEVVPKALSMIERPLHIRHQAGRGKDGAVMDAYAGRAGVRVDAFIDDMEEAYRWAQIVIARSGALTLAELASAGRPAILVPFAFAAGNHQEANARAAQVKGAAVCITEKELNAQALSWLIEKWLADPAIPTTMAESAAQSARRGAAKLIVDDLLQSSVGRKADG